MAYASRSDEITREYFDSILISTSYLDSDVASTRMELFGKAFETPIMTAALSHLHNTCENGMVKFAQGAHDAGAVHFVGMSADENSNVIHNGIRDAELENILDTEAATVKIVKPHADDELIFAKLKHAAEYGAFAVGMDIDHAIGSDGDYDNVLGLSMRMKSSKQLEAYVRATELPFVVKGVLSVKDAVKSAEAGAGAIILSHHHGMMDYMVPPLMVLPEIKKEVGDRLKIFVDCGIERGLDVFKALALGADAVCVGRALMGPLKDKGSEGVTAQINRMNSELKAAMARTGARTLAEIDPSVLRFRHF